MVAGAIAEVELASKRCSVERIEPGDAFAAMNVLPGREAAWTVERAQIEIDFFRRVIVRVG